jgi:hypothetical protein
MQAAVITHTISSGSLVIPGTSTDDYVITGSTTSSTVTINSGYQGTITLRNLNISIASGTTSPISVLGLNNCDNFFPVTNVDVILEGNNVLYFSGSTAPCFRVDQGAQINISAIDPADNNSGKLSAKVASTGQGAGIGAGTNYNQGSATLSSGGTGPTAGGNVIISSGTIDAKGGHGAGIGGGFGNYYNGVILIYGGVVNAEAIFDAAGIGSGCPVGTGIINVYAPRSTIVAIPPAQITARGAGASASGGVGYNLYPSLGLAGTKAITYIGDPNKPQITVHTEDYEKNADIYADLSETPSVSEPFTALAVPLNLNSVKFGKTNASTGVYTTYGRLDQPVTFFTDASSSKPETLGRPYKPTRVNSVTAATDVILPLLNVNMSLVVMPATPLEAGYSAAQATTNAYRLKVTYSDTKPMTGVTYELQNGTATDFTGLNFFGPDGTTSIAAPATLSNGTVFYIQVPIKTGKAIGIYQDVLRFSGTWDGASTGYIRQVVTQRVVYDDTNTNTYIKVTAAPAQFTTNNAATATAALTLNITHAGLSIPYDQSDVTARFLITTNPNYESALAASPLSTWTVLNAPATDGANAGTTAAFAGKPEGTYYIHWYVTSGTVYAHSLTVVGPPPATYGGFGPYIIDTTAPTVTLAVDGSTTTKEISSNAGLPVTLTFNEAIKNPGTDLTVADFEILVSGKATISAIAVVPASGDKIFTATLTPSNSLANGESFTVKLKANAVTDVAGNNNTASNTVTVTYSNTAKPAVTFNTAPAYSTLRPSFTVDVVASDFAINGNIDLYQTAGGSAIINSSNLAALFTITPEGGSPLSTSVYSAVYSKSGSGASAKGVITFNFPADLTNSTNYTVALAAGKFFNLLQNGNDAGSAVFMIAEPDFTGGASGISASPNLFASDGGTTTLTVKGQGLKLNADASLLTLRVACAAIGYDSGQLSSGFVIDGTQDVLTITGVTVPANTGSTTLTHTFTLYMTFDGPETSTGKTCSIQVEPAMSHIVTVVNTTASAGDLTYGYATSDAQAAARRQNITVTNNGALTLNTLTVSFTGPDGTSFTNTTPLPATGLAAGSTSTFYVYLQTGKNAGNYAGGAPGSETKVMVTATPGSGSPLNGTAELVQQKVLAATGTGTEATVTGNPNPNVNVMTQNSILFTASVTPGDELLNWKYAVVTSNVRPADAAPVWTTVGGGTATSTHTFADGTLDNYYVFYEVNTNNYNAIQGQVDNGSGVEVYVVDLALPTVTNIAPERTVTNSTPFDVVITFSELVGEMDASKFIATNATVSNLTPVGTPVDGRYLDYKITVTPYTGLTDGDVINISVQAAAGEDEATNPSLPSSAAKNMSVMYNGTNPTVTLSTPDLTVNSNFTVTVTFSKAISGFTESDIDILNGAVVGSSLTPAGGSGLTFTFVVNTAGSSSGLIDISIPEDAVLDDANNGNLGGSLTVDFREPTDRIAPVLSYTGPAYENGQFNVNVTFSRNITGLTAADFTYVTADFGTPVLTGSGKNYILTLTPLVNKDNTTPVSLSPAPTILDEYGNTLNNSNTVNANYDTRRPEVLTIVSVPPITEVNFDPFTVEVTVDEPTGLLDPSKLVLTGLDLVEILSGPVLSGGSTIYELSVKVAPGTLSESYLSLALGEGAVKDKANNPNKPGAGSTPLSILFIDNIPPEIINVSVPPTNVPPNGDIDFTFDEPIDESVPGGSIWVEDIGYIPVDQIEWIDESTVRLDYGHLDENITYTVRIAGYTDLAGNVMAPRTFTFTTGDLVFPELMRPITIHVGANLTVSAAINEVIFVNSRDNFSFTVWPKEGYNLDNLTVTTGIPLRDSDGLSYQKNDDGSVTVTLLYVTETLNVFVSITDAEASEAIEASKVWTYGNQVYIYTGNAATLSIYTLNGSLFNKLSVGAGETVVSLPRGYYTIILNGKTYKVLVR